MTISDRRDAVNNLVHIRGSIKESIQALQQYEWDSDEEFADLGPAELRHALGMFLTGTLSPADLETWANGVEVREDINFHPREIIDLITELANPTLFQALTPESASRLLDRVSSIETRHD